MPSKTKAQLSSELDSLQIRLATLQCELEKIRDAIEDVLDQFPATGFGAIID